VCINLKQECKQQVLYEKIKLLALLTQAVIAGATAV
jgi:hypothetical protein